MVKAQSNACYKLSFLSLTQNHHFFKSNLEFSRSIVMALAKVNDGRTCWCTSTCSCGPGCSCTPSKACAPGCTCSASGGQPSKSENNVSPISTVKHAPLLIPIDCEPVLCDREAADRHLLLEYFGASGSVDCTEASASPSCRRESSNLADRLFPKAQRCRAQETLHSAPVLAGAPRSWAGGAFEPGNPISIC